MKPNTIQVIPSVDILNGKVVRLFQGDYHKVTEYPELPSVVVSNFIKHNFNLVHIVNLDGAKSENNTLTQTAIEEILQLGCQIQIGGGIRTLKTAQTYASMGAKVILGTICVKNPQLTEEIIKTIGSENTILAFDCKANKNGEYEVMVNGWQEGDKTTLSKMLELYSNYRLSILCTDISVDGTLTSPNFSLYRWIKKHYPHYYLQASGGVASTEDIIKLHEDHIDAVIVGRALHHGMISISQLAKVCQ